MASPFLSQSLPRPLDGTNVVTASDLVRRFGLWQERAGREPVYVLHRGRPRFVLTSVDIMQALCTPHETVMAGGETAGIDALLDLTREIIVLVNRDLTLIAASRAARRYFGSAAQQGTPLRSLTTATGMVLIEQAVRRVLGSGLAETIEIAAPFAGRTLAVAIEPCLAGAALLAHDVTVIDDLAAARATAQAEAEALTASGIAATVRINLRGYLEEPLGSLAAMARIKASALVGVRFVTLIEMGSRVALGAALETAISSASCGAIDAALLVADAAPQPVRIGLSPVRRGSIVEAIAAAVVTHQGGS